MLGIVLVLNSAKDQSNQVYSIIKTSVHQSPDRLATVKVINEEVPCLLVPVHFRQKRNSVSENYFAYTKMDLAFLRIVFDLKATVKSEKKHWLKTILIKKIYDPIKKYFGLKIILNKNKIVLGLNGLLL